MADIRAVSVIQSSDFRKTFDFSHSIFSLRQLSTPIRVSSKKHIVSANKSQHSRSDWFKITHFRLATTYYTSCRSIILDYSVYRRNFNYTLSWVKHQSFDSKKRSRSLIIGMLVIYKSFESQWKTK